MSARSDASEALEELADDDLRGALDHAPAHRGDLAADIDAILDAVDALQAYALANAATLEEVEVNPLICTPGTAIAADALIRKAETP